MLYILLSVFGCGSTYSIGNTAGTWIESNYQFSNNTCQLQSTITESLNLSYTLAASDNAQLESYEYDTGEPLIDALNQQNSNLWALCQEEEEPTFSCDFPTLLIHFDQWKEGFPPYDASVNSECTLSLNGYTEGLFVDDNEAFVSGYINADCLAISSDVEEVSCNTSFASSWIKQ